MAKVTLPNNPYISSFDYNRTFDLTQGQLKIDILNSVIQNPAGITGVKVEIITPTGSVISSPGYVFTPANINSSYNTPLPRVLKTFMWGVYKTKVTLTLQGVDYVDERDFNLCAVDGENPFSNSRKGKMEMTVDCAMGKVKVSGLAGYTYRQTEPSSETRDITFYYPRESDLAPQKNISNIPFEIPARRGNNAAKGSLVSTYQFPESTTVIFQTTAEVDRDVRCDSNLSAVYCALEKLYTSGCGSIKCTDEICEANTLINLITIGERYGLDTGEHVQALENLLNVSCDCGGCLGELIKPDIGNGCPSVTALDAFIKDFQLQITFNTSGIDISNSLIVEYRPKSTSPNGPWQQVGQQFPVQGTNQQINISVMQVVQYEVRVTVICGNTQSTPVQVDSNIPANSNCVDLVSIEGVSGAGAPPTTTGIPTTTVAPPTTTLLSTTTIMPTTTVAPTTTVLPTTTVAAPTTTSLPTTTIPVTTGPVTTIAPTTTAAVIAFRVGYQATDPYVNDSTIPAIANSFDVNIAPGDNLAFNLPQAAEDNFWVVRELATEPIKDGWSHTLTTGTIPDVAIRAAFVIGIYRYYITRSEFALTYTEPINLFQ